MTLKNYAVPNLSQQLAPKIRHKIDQKTKPQGALGALESLALQIALIQNTLSPKLNQPTMLVFAGDHGITQEAVSPYPQAVTAQMVLNFLNGGAAINVFANLHGMHLQVIDSGVNHDFTEHSHLVNAKIGKGTRNFLREPAMSLDECEQAMARGAGLVAAHVKAGTNVFGFGEMGIGNTSSASCLMSVLCDIPIAQCVGRGTGLDDVGLQRKTEILRQALNHHRVDASQPMHMLATFGGFEIAMMAGAMLAAAQHSTLLLIDGFIATSALLVAAKLEPNILDYCVFSHCSDESGHRLMLDHFQAQPLLNLGLRLGEGTGAVLAYSLVQSAVAFLNEMASFESAGVSEKNA
jgi:nicotinate-nucleotide--dimethylbenzimidazole phosphoribosyltransferase